MKKLTLISFALALVMSLLTLAQEATQPGEHVQIGPCGETGIVGGRFDQGPNTRQIAERI